jgi:signal transduction histidine kinase
VLLSPLSINFRVSHDAESVFRITATALLCANQVLAAMFTWMYAGVAGAGVRGARHAIERERELTMLKDQFLIDANHELRTPVMAWYANVEVLAMLANRATPNQRARLIGRAMEAGDVVRRLLLTLLDASVVEAAVPRVNLRPVQLAALTRALLETFDPHQIGEPGLEDISYETRAVTLAISEDLWVVADEDRLRQILTNLLTNALKYSARSTPITIAAERTSEIGPSDADRHPDRRVGGTRRSSVQPNAQRHVQSGASYVRVSVQDAGQGIPLRDVPKLFQRFVRLERDIAGPVRGTGVGLYLCRVLVEAMGGRIWVESAGVAGEGSTFIFTLPFILPAGNTSATADAAQAPELSGFAGTTAQGASTLRSAHFD